MTDCQTSRLQDAIAELQEEVADLRRSMKDAEILYGAGIHEAIAKSIGETGTPNGAASIQMAKLAGGVAELQEALEAERMLTRQAERERDRAEAALAAWRVADDKIGGLLTIMASRCHSENYIVERCIEARTAIHAAREATGDSQ